MTDTPEYIFNKQFEIFFSKPLKERLLMNFEMTEFVREATRRRIKRNHPEYSELDIKIEMFKQFYSDYFSVQQLNSIVNHFINSKSV